MRRTRLQLRSFALVVSASLAVWALEGTVTPAAAQQAEQGRVVNVKVHGRSLEGNLSGESPDRDVSIYLPPDYDRDTARRYPVVYLLHGYSLTNAYWIGDGSQGSRSIDVPGAMDRDIANGRAREMILVMPNGDSKYDGSMYSNSVTSGNWEGFIAEDLVGYVDSHYRAIADRRGRGLAGHSMGGYGTVRIGMKRPDVFSSLYILSACCLMNDPAAFARRNAAAERAGSNGESRAPNGESRAPSGESRGPSGESAGQSGERRERNRGGGFPNVVKAEAAAWSPNPQNPPSYFDLPGGGTAEDSLIAAKWAANSPLAMIDQYIPNLKRYTSIGMDVGLQDGLKASNERLAGVLAAYGIEHAFETYEGDHVNRIAERMEQKVIPFFSEHLASE
jgi:S-formylglutathione hydrolase